MFLFLLLATPVDFSTPVDPATSEWIGLLMGTSPKSLGLHWWGDNIYPIFVSGKDASMVTVKKMTPMDPGLFLRVDPKFIYKGEDYSGNKVGQVWMVMEVLENNPTANSDPDVQVTYDAANNRNSLSGNGMVSLNNTMKWRSFVFSMPSPYFNKRYEPFVGRSRDISVTPLSFLGSWLGVRRLVLFKEMPRYVVTLNTGNPYPQVGDEVPLEVSVIDGNNLPVSGKEVHFQIVSGNGMLKDLTAVTDSNGVAKTEVRVSGYLPIVVKAYVDSEPPVDKIETVGAWDFSSGNDGWSLPSQISWDSSKGHDSLGSLKFYNPPDILFSWNDGNASYISNPGRFKWDSSKYYSGSQSIKFENPKVSPPASVDPDGDGVSEFLDDGDFSSDPSGVWSYDNSQFQWDTAEGHDASGCMKYLSGDGVNFHQSVDFASEGITSGPFWICVCGWVNKSSGAEGNAYYDIWNSTYDVLNSPTPPADGKWYPVSIYEWFDSDPGYLEVRGARDGGASGTVYFDDVQVEVGQYNNPNPSFELPVAANYKVGLGAGWNWNWNSTDGRLEATYSNIHFMRWDFTKDGAYSSELTSAKDGHAVLIAEPLSGATADNLHDDVPHGAIVPGAWYKISGWIFRSSDYNGNSYIDIYSWDYYLANTTTHSPELGFNDLRATAPGWNYVETWWQVPSDWNSGNMTLQIRCVLDGNPTAGYVAFDNVTIERVEDSGDYNDVLTTLSLNSGDTVFLRGYIYKALVQGRAYIDLYESGGSADGPDAEVSSSYAWGEVTSSWSVPVNGNYQLRLVTDGNPRGKIWYDEVRLEKANLAACDSRRVVNVEPGETYKLSGWIYRDPDYSGNVYLDLYNDTASDPELGFQDLRVTEAGKWVYVEGTWTNVYGVTQVAIRAVFDGYPTGAVWVDDVRLEKIERKTEGLVSDTLVLTPTPFAFAGPSSSVYTGMEEEGVLVFMEGATGSGSSETVFWDNFSDMSNWDYDSSKFHWDNTYSYDPGTGSVKFTPNAPAQDMRTKSGYNVYAQTYYRFSCYARGETTAGAWYLDFGDYGGEPQLSVGGSPNWQYYFTYWFSESDGTIPAIRLVADGGPEGVLWVDQIRLEKLDYKYQSWGMGFADLNGFTCVVTGLEPSNNLTHYLLMDVDGSFGAPGSDFYITVLFFDNGTTPVVKYNTASAGIQEAVLKDLVSQEGGFKYAVYQATDADFTVDMKTTPDLTIYDAGSTMYIAGVWVSKIYPIPESPTLEDTFEGVKVLLPEKGVPCKVFRREKGSSQWQDLGVAVDEYLDTGIVKGKVYEYRVASFYGMRVLSPYSASVEIVPKNVLSSGEVKLNKEILSSGEALVVYANVGEEVGRVRVGVYSLSGIKVFQTQASGRGTVSLRVDTAGLTSGLYFVDVNIDERVRKTLKFVLKKPR